MIKLIVHSLFLVAFAINFATGSHIERGTTTTYFPVKSEKLTFEKDIKSIMNTFCGGIFCHHGKPSAWTKYEVVKLAIESGSFKKQVIDDKTMPKRKKLPPEEYETIKKWLEEGAIEK